MKYLKQCTIIIYLYLYQNQLSLLSKNKIKLKKFNLYSKIIQDNIKFDISYINYYYII